MLALVAVLLLPFALVGISESVGGRPLPLGRLPAALFGAGLVTAADLPAVRSSTRRLQFARYLGALTGLAACAVPVLLAHATFAINAIWLLAGVALGATVGQWWVGRIPRRSRRSAPLARRRLVDLVGRTPLVLCAVMFSSAVVLDALWMALRPGGSRFHTLPSGDTCVTPVVPSVARHLSAWAVVAPISLISVIGAMIILRRAVDPTVPASADSALRGAAMRTVLGGGLLVVGGHALLTAVEAETFMGSPCVPSSVWRAGAAGLALFGTLVMLCWCVAVYVLAPARRPAPLLVPEAPAAVAVS